MKYKISIIIPVYNAGKFIKNLLDSIIVQNIGFDNLEIIIVDDHSTDESGRIIDEQAARYDNIIAIHLPENSKGAGKPRNVGMDVATSEYLMFMDADDIYAEDALKILHEKITREDVDIVCGTYSRIDEVTKKRRKIPLLLDNKEINELKLQTINDKMSFLENSQAVWTKIFKKKFLKQHNLRFYEGIANEDLVFVTHAYLKAEGIIFLNQVVVHYNNLISESITHKPDSLKSWITGFWETYVIYRENGYEEFFLKQILKSQLKYWVEKFLIFDLSDTEKSDALELVRPLFQIFKDYESLQPLYLKPIFKNISSGNFDKAILLIDQMGYIKKLEFKQKKTIYKLQTTRTQLKNKNELIKEKNSKYKNLIDENKALKAQYYEFQYENNVNRPMKQRLISWFPSIYIVLNARKTGFKNALENIRGYRSIRKNNYLDIGYYLVNNKDVRTSGMDPVLHYIYMGYWEGRKPNPTFDGDEYIKKNRDIKNSNLNPLIHYSLYGNE